MAQNKIKEQVMILGKLFVAKISFAIIVFVALNANATAVEPLSEYSINEIQQSNNYYNYIKNIQPSVDKYFPEYSGYFKNVLGKFNDYGTAEKYIINKWIEKAIGIYNNNGQIKKESDKIGTILIVFDFIEGNGNFIKDKNITDGDNDEKINAANSILQAIKREYTGAKKDIADFKNYLKGCKEKTTNGITSSNANEIINHSEKYMQYVKEYIIDAGMIKEETSIQERIKSYIKLLNITGREPSKVGKIYIDEYNRINKK